MSLTDSFRHAAPAATWAAFSAVPDLEAVLDRIFQEGQASWPQLPIQPDLFAAFLGRQLPPEVAEALDPASLRAGELLLVCALTQGLPAAQAVFEASYLSRVRRALVQRGTAEAAITDIQQNLYKRLLEKQGAASERRGYNGTGDLVSWLCTCALREANLQHKGAQRTTELTDAAQDLLRDLGSTPERGALSGQLKELFQAAFREAIASLTSRERNLLRYHFLSELSIDQIGAIYHVHRATAARWLVRAQDRLAAKTRELFAQRARISADSLPHIMELIQSQLSVNLGSVLKGGTEQDTPPRGAGAKPAAE